MYVNILQIYFQTYTKRQRQNPAHRHLKRTDTHSNYTENITINLNTQIMKIDIPMYNYDDYACI